MLWDIFCRVIDNYGDIGVSWRLCANLAARGEQLRLWVDDASALQWMAPGAQEGRWPGIEVMDWNASCTPSTLQTLPAADVWIETFGCDIPEAFVAHRAQALSQAGATRPVWVNLEYLSAEPYVQRSHGLPSPVMQGPARGWTKYFYYPGFTRQTGGLLREPDQMGRIAGHDAQARGDFLDQLGIRTAPPEVPECLVSLFCYEPPLLQALLAHLAAQPSPVRLLVTPGRAAEAVRALLAEQTVHGALRISYLPALSQSDFDRLLWSCDINFVRGEDSVLRALWAGKPFVWHIYAQHDQAHSAKLEAFLEQLELGPEVRSLHRAWNGLLTAGEAATALLPLTGSALPTWRAEVQSARARLLEMDDLACALQEFVLKNR